MIELLLLFSNELPLCVTITLIIIAQLLITVQRLQSNLKQTEYEKISIMKYDYIYIYVRIYVCARARAHTHTSLPRIYLVSRIFTISPRLYIICLNCDYRLSMIMMDRYDYTRI